MRIVCREHLLPQSADGQYAPVQCNLPGHSEITAYPAFGQRGNNACGDGDARRWAIFGQRILGKVNMQIGGIQEARVDLQFIRSRTDIGKCGYYRFAHDLAELAGHQQVPFSGHGSHFYRQQDAAIFGYSQAHCYTNKRFLIMNLPTVALRAQILVQSAAGDAQLGIWLFEDETRCFATDGSQLSFKVAYACFTRIAGYNILHDRPWNFHLLRRKAMFGQDLWQQVSHADVDFFLERVRGEFDDIHAISQDAGNLVLNIAGADKEYF